MAAILTATGRSGSRNSPASGVGASPPVAGRRAMRSSAADNSLICNRPPNKAPRSQSRTTSCKISQTPSSSAKLIRSALATELSAPRKPSIETSRPASDRASCKKFVKKSLLASVSSWAKGAETDASTPSQAKAMRIRYVRKRFKMPVRSRHRFPPALTLLRH